MFPEKAYDWGTTRSCIRELAEYGAARKREIGAENVYDFALGNPSVEPPACLKEALLDLISNDTPGLHAYTTAAGRYPLRRKIAGELNSRFGTAVTPELIYVTCGAAGSLTATLQAILSPGEEILCLAPFFPEYRVFTENAGGVAVIVPPAPDFQPDFAALEQALRSPKAKAVIVNSPNNPSGAVYTESTLTKIAELLTAASQGREEPVYLITDEPYRELVYDGKSVPCPMNFYPHCVMCYSWSKSLSIPGERIGYIAVSERLHHAQDFYYKIMGAARGMGHVNPPSLFQQIMERCIGQTVDAGIYQRNRDILCDGLQKLGYEFVHPDGAFYLFLKALEPDAKAFSDRAKAHELLLVPSDDFGCTGYVRIAYCVPEERIVNSLPAFAALMREYNP